MSETILVTGGAGFIGSALVRTLLERTEARVVNLDALTYAGNPDSVAEVALHPRYRFERSWMQGQVRRTSDPRSSAARAQRHLTVPTRHLLLQRVAVGLAGVLTLLGAEVAVDAEVQREVPGYA